MITDYFKKEKNIKISLPNFHNQAFLNLCFLTLQEHNKEALKIGYEIVSADGCFPYSIWSNVRERHYLSKTEMEATLNMYSKHNININYIFDNEFVTKEDLSDRFSNLMLEMAYKQGNGVYVKSNILYDYIKKNYPLLNLIKIADPIDFDKKNIAINPKYNNQFDIKTIKHKDSAYITLNPLCEGNCKNYENHLKYIENEQINYNNVSDIYICPIKRDFNFFDLKKNKNFISDKKIEELKTSGFRNFRIDFPYIERCIDVNYSIYDTIESYIYYLIKDEHKDEVRRVMNKKFAGNKKNGKI